MERVILELNTFLDYVALQIDFNSIADCVVSPWGEWDIGGGWAIRYRTIKKEAVGSGKPCPEDLLQTKQCSLEKCPSIILSFILLASRNFPAGNIVLESTGGAAEYRGAFLGEFVEQEENDYNGRPFYRQRETEGGQEKLLRFEQNSWWVSSVLRNKQSTDIPPATDWEYFSLDKKWKNDTTLRLRFSNLTPCKLVRVSSDEEEVKRHISHKLGNYNLLEKRWSSGRPIYQKTNSEQDWFLLVPNRTTIWVIRGSISDKRAKKYVASGRATNLPTDAEAGPRPDDGVKQWRYWNGNGYKEGNISITCSL